MKLEKHWNIIHNTVNDHKSNSIKEMPSAHRDITKSGILDQVICIRGSKHSEDRASRCDRGGYRLDRIVCRLVLYAVRTGRYTTICLIIGNLSSYLCGIYRCIFTIQCAG